MSKGFLDVNFSRFAVVFARTHRPYNHGYLENRMHTPIVHGQWLSTQSFVHTNVHGTLIWKLGLDSAYAMH